MFSCKRIHRGRYLHFFIILIRFAIHHSELLMDPMIQVLVRSFPWQRIIISNELAVKCVTHTRTCSTFIHLSRSEHTIIWRRFMHKHALIQTLTLVAERGNYREKRFTWDQTSSLSWSVPRATGLAILPARAARMPINSHHTLHCSMQQNLTPSSPPRSSWPRTSRIYQSL